MNKSNKDRAMCSKEKLESIVNLNNWKMLTEYINANKKTTFECHCGNVWTTTTSNIFKGSGCPQCSLRGITSRAMGKHDCAISQIGLVRLGDWNGVHAKTLYQCNYNHKFVSTPASVKSCKSCKLDKTVKTYDSMLALKHITRIGDWLGMHTKILHKCKYNHTWSTTPASLRIGKVGCPECAIRGGGFKPHKSGYVYVYKWVDNLTGHSFYKFGITNNQPKFREKNQSKKTKYTPELIFAKQFNYGYDAQCVESIIKTSIKCGVIDKRIFGDGYTETFDGCETCKVVCDIINNYKSKE